MKYCRLFHILVLSVIILLLSVTLSPIAVFTAIPTHAAGEDIHLSAEEGEIGDRIEIEGEDFEAETTFRGIKWTDADGEFTITFTVPNQLTDGEDEEDVHGGDYYIYVTYHRSTNILAVANFTVIGGEIEINPEVGQVGTAVGISGIRFGISQEISVEYDADSVGIASGDKETNDKGEFTCTIIIPESTFGDHTITVTDESGNEPEVDFSVKPQITIDPTSGTVGEVIQIRGTGFQDRDYMTITFEDYRISTIPLSLYAKANGSFRGSFMIPYHAVGGTSKIRASDEDFNAAEAELTILAGISLTPATSQSSPGYAGMELTLYGTGFTAETQITITYDNSTVDTVTTDNMGRFSETFIIPPSIAGDHTITVTSDTDTTMFTVTIESEAPPIPVPLLPEMATTAEAETYFDWEEVDDPSGITYTLQVGNDANFSAIVVEKTGLTQSEYTITKEEKLGSPETDTSYYWRVKATDGAFNEGKWTIPILFYVALPQQEVTPNWILYIGIGLGVLVLGVLGFWVFKRIKG
jgi:hypothetical protein